MANRVMGPFYLYAGAAPMDPALETTVEALLDPKRVSWSLQRPDPGQEPSAQEIFVGLGTRDAGLAPHPRMLSWKLPQWRSERLRSTTEVVLRSAAMLDALPFPFMVRAHEPTLDALLATVLAAYRVASHRWPEGIDALVEYVSEWEQGRTEYAGQYERALASSFYAGLQVFRTDGSAAPAKELVTLLARVIDSRLTLEQLGALPPAFISARVTRRLRADADLYRAELSRAWKVQLDVPLDAMPDSAYRRIDALFLSSPQDVTVLKLLARPDTEASLYRRGFELMAVHAPNERQPWAKHTISLAPESPGSLAELAQRLDQLEGDTTPDGQPRVKTGARFTHQPAELGGLSDPWYSDGYAWPRGRSTIVAPPFAGTKLSREEIWEAVWRRYNVGRNVHVTASRSVFVRPYRVVRQLEVNALVSHGWQKTSWPQTHAGFLPSVVSSFLDGSDVVHLEKKAGERTVHVALYPSHLALVWVEVTGGRTTLLELTEGQAKLRHSQELESLEPLKSLGEWLEPIGHTSWFVYGSYRINRARSTMLDGSRSVQGLFHALASGEAPTLQHLPSESAAQARTVHSHRDVEHWFTSTGGARLELRLDDDLTPPPLDPDFALFLLTTGQRYAAFEITRRMSELEKRGRTSRWQALRPTTDLRADVMLFTNTLWYARVSDDPDLDARYDAWRALHGMQETVESLRSQTAEIDEYRKERFENMVAVMLFVFLPITIVCGFFSGAQFNDMELKLGLPWTTGGWKIFMIYTAIFTVVVFGTVLLARVVSWRKRGPGN